MLKIKPIGIDTYGENVAFLSRDCASYRPEDFQALNKIEVLAGDRRLLAVLNIVDDPQLLAPDELGLSTVALRRLGSSAGDLVSIVQAAAPRSLDAVRAKIGGSVLTAAELRAVIRDVTAHSYSKMEIAAFLIACASFMTTGEVLDLTRAMAEVGTKLDWGHGPIVDKHCIGGLPGNRTSMIVVPIVAAHGLRIPKTSSRAITSPAGTADTMEVLAKVDLNVERMQDVVRETNGCLVWGGHVNLSPADDILIAVERPLGIDAREQMVASILSKKLAAGSSHLLIDVPVGPSAKVRSAAEAIRLRKLFEFVGDSIGLEIDVAITDGSQPIGSGIGPVLEARDVMAVLRGDASASADLRERSVMLAGRVLEFDPAMRGGMGEQRARELLDGGQALRAMERIIECQGPASSVPTVGPLTREVVAARDGTVRGIDCFRLARIARAAGAPFDKGAGIDMQRKIGDSVRRNEPLYRIYARMPTNFAFANGAADEDAGYRIE
ncbi:MAG TPA: thymidine phosphorylase family protein [Candidatus Cybelea sp.]|nr:thymidine phosphorylase family protein [Candidatus Cybelea sp.]